MKNLFIIIFLSLLTIGCMKDDMHDEEPVEISVSLPSAEIESTKSTSTNVAVVDSTVRILAYKDVSRRVIVSEATFKMTEENKLVSCTVDDYGAEVGTIGSVGTNKMYLPSSGVYYIDAIIPAIKVTQEGIAKVVNDTDLMYSKGSSSFSVTQAGTVQSLVLEKFTHQCSLLQVDIRIVSSISNTITSIGNDGVVLLSQRNGPLDFDMSTGTFKTFGELNRDIKLTEFTEMDAANATNPQFEPEDLASDPGWFLSDSLAIFPTLNVESDLISVKAHLIIAQSEIRLQSEAFSHLFRKGYSYKFVLTQNSDGILLFLTVQPWNPRGFTSNLGGTIAYFIGAWSDVENNWGTSSGEDAEYTISDWTDAVEWQGDFSGGFEASPILLPGSVDWEEGDLGTKGIKRIKRG